MGATAAPIRLASYLARPNQVTTNRRSRGDILRGKSAGDGIDGVQGEGDKVVVRFWHLWATSQICRDAVTSSPKDSAYRNPPLLELRVRSLSNVFPPQKTGIDVCRLFTGAPELLNWDANEMTNAIVQLKKTVPELDGVAMSRVPTLLLVDIKHIAQARDELITSSRNTHKGSTHDPETLLFHAKQLAAGANAEAPRLQKR